MHIKGSWRPLERGEPSSVDGFPNFDLHISEAVTVLENDRYKIVYEGEIFDFTDPKILGDPSILDRAYGYYTYVSIDKKKREIYIGTDRLGYSALYHASEGDRFLFSSSPTLLKYELSTTTPNFEAWDEILSIGDIIGKKTVVTEISRARWGQKFRLRPDSVDTIDIWSPETPPFVDPQRYIRDNNELLIEAMALTETSERQKVIFLTGGHDSRRLAIAAHRVGLPITCATQAVISKFGEDEDTLIAENVAQCLGFPIISHPVQSSPANFNDSLIKDFWIAFESNYHEWALPLLRQIPQGALIYSGDIGDVTINGGQIFRSRPGAVSNYADLDYMARLICGEKTSLIAAKHISTPLFERVRAELAICPDTPHRLTYFFMLNHARRNINSWCFLFKLHNHVPCLPYMYHPLFVQSLSIDPKHHLDVWLQMECMKQMHPAAAGFPSPREQSPSENFQDYRAEAKAQLHFATRNLRTRRDARVLLPGLRRQLIAFEIFSKLRIWSHAESLIWAASIASRFSNYLDWMEDRDGPGFPVTSETVELLERNFVH